MASTLDVRLRIPKFFVSTSEDDNTQYISSSDADKDIIFEFQCDSIKKELSDGVGGMVLPNFAGALVIALPVVKYHITITGRFHENTHTAHPVSTATAHAPDFIDIEEMSLMWNKAAGVKQNGDVDNKARLPQIHTDYERSSADTIVTGGNVLDGWRTFRGIIVSSTLVREAGRTSGDFSILFAVLYSPGDSITTGASNFPSIREWA